MKEYRFCGCKGIIYAILIAFFMSLTTLNIFAATGVAEAHSQPAAKVKLPAINFYDGDTLHQVTFEDMNSYYRGISGGRAAEVEVAASYRAFLAAKTVLWGKSIPHRDDIIITSTLPSYASVICFKYITGTGTDQPGVENMGEFNLVLPDGTEVQDLSFESLQQLSKNTSTKNYTFTVTRKSTGESFTAKIKAEVFPQNYFQLAGKSIDDIAQAATSGDLDEYVSQQLKIVRNLQTLPDWELFEDIPRPFPIKLAAAFFLAGVLAVGITIYLLKKKRQAQ